MSSTNKTPNYNLPQWVASDKPERTDFNTAFSDIDTNLNLVESKADSVTANFNASFVGGYFGFTSDVLASAAAAPYQRISFITTGADTLNLPEAADAWKYASGLIMKRSNSFINIVLFYGLGGRIATNTTSDGGSSWSGWKVTVFPA